MHFFALTAPPGQNNELMNCYRSIKRQFSDIDAHEAQIEDKSEPAQRFSIKSYIHSRSMCLSGFTAVLKVTQSTL